MVDTLFLSINAFVRGSSSLPPSTKQKLKHNMGLFNILGSVVSATVKTALTPVAVVKDVYNIAVDNEVDATQNLLGSAVEDLEDAWDETGDMFDA
jgi:hypothetical protein